MTAFSIAIQTLFNDRNVSRDAFFLPLMGSNKAVRVITRAPDIYQNIGQSVIETPSLVLEVQVADCPSIVPGDQFMVDGITYSVQGVPRRDSEQLVWQLDVYAS
jgi:hypothetical protein